MAELKAALPALPVGAVWDDGETGPILRVAARASAPTDSISFRLPVTAPVEAIHVSMDISATDLLLGKQEWDDGRILIRWISETGNGAGEIDPVASVRDNDRKDGISLVMEPCSGAGYPALVIENLGSAGEMVISDLVLTPVSHRTSWRWARWIVAACWFSWLFACLSGFPKVPAPRRATAAALWVVMGALFAFPGPWERISPMLIPYDLGESAERHDKTAGVKPATPEIKTPQGFVSQGALGKISDQNGWIIQVRNHLKKQRLLLHTGFMVGATLLFSYLLGPGRAAWLAGGLVIMIEGAQTGFGYGFDFEDVMDLVCGAAGITIGWLLFVKLNKWSAISRWMALPPAELAAPSVADGTPDERKS